uniref:WRKY domain-containing protein n=1 Tax=Cannabis sativa TaxID=3483 RepID=A0A803PQ62_CANSA
MAEDWDLYAVVRSCKSTTTTSSWAVSDSASVTTTMMDSMQGSGQTTSSSSVDTLSCLASLTFEEEKDPKNQQKKTVCHVTADNLSTDVWAWRKYGQKPIKGTTTVAVAQKVVRRENKLSETTTTQNLSSSLTPETTLTLVQLTGTHSPEVLVINYLLHQTLLNNHKNSDQSPSTTTPKLSPAPQTEQDPAAKTLVILPEERESDDQKQSDVISMEEEELMMDIDALNEDHEDEDEGVLIPNMSLADDDFFLGLKEFGCTTPGAAC